MKQIKLFSVLLIALSFLLNGCNAQTQSDSLKLIAARTSLFIPELNQLIVASPSDFNSNAALMIFEVK